MEKIEDYCPDENYIGLTEEDKKHIDQEINRKTMDGLQKLRSGKMEDKYCKLL
jgi:hypothetical protein